jgi:Family of unknown function (DUF5675)
VKIKVIRETYTDKSTIGKLYIDGEYQCYTLEDKVRPKTEEKKFGDTAIDAGTYRMIVNHSARFREEMPLLLNVPGFEGVRLHWGNTDVDTHGCLLVGLGKAKDFISESRKAYALVFKQIYAAFTSGKTITVEIQDTVQVKAPEPKATKVAANKKPAK